MPIFSAYAKLGGMERVGRNIRYLLWRKGVDRDEWQTKLSEGLGCSSERAGELLEGHGAGLTPREKQALAKAIGPESIDLVADLIGKHGVDVLAENIRYLLNGLPHGQKKEFAATMGVDVTTVSRWISGDQRPSKKKLVAIGKYFGLPAEIELDSEAIFLWTEPITDEHIKNWITLKIRQVNGKTLRDIFPALRRLLKE